MEKSILGLEAKKESGSSLSAYALEQLKIEAFARMAKESLPDVREECIQKSFCTVVNEDVLNEVARKISEGD